MFGFKKLLAWMVGAALIASGAVALVFNMTNVDSYRDACKGYPIAMSTARGALQSAGSDDAREFWVTRILVLAADAKDDKCAVDPAGYLAGFVTPQASATPTPTAPTKKDETKKVDSDKWKYHFYTLDEGKTGTHNFGPPVKGGKAAANGDKKALAKIKAEFWNRLEHDPALLAANGGQILDGKDGGIKLTKKLMKSKKARDAYLAKVKKAVKSMKVEERSPQTVDSAYMVVGADGVPRTYAANNVWRASTYYVLVVKTTKGKTYDYRLECGFQWDTGMKVVPVVYTPVVRSPYTTALPCVNGNDRNDAGRCSVPPRHHHNPPPSGGCKSHCSTPPPHGGCKSHCGNTAKDPSQDPVHHGNAGNGGGRNQDPGPGAVTNPTHAPSGPRTNPAQPTTGGGNGSGNGNGGSDGGSTHVDPEPGAPNPDDPATGTIKDP